MVDITISYRIHGWHKNFSVPLSRISFPLHSYKKTTPSQSHSDNQKQGVIEQAYISESKGLNPSRQEHHYLILISPTGH